MLAQKLNVEVDLTAGLNLVKNTWFDDAVHTGRQTRDSWLTSRVDDAINELSGWVKSFLVSGSKSMR
jgi:hypothetical protein